MGALSDALDKENLKQKQEDTDTSQVNSDNLSDDEMNLEDLDSTSTSLGGVNNAKDSNYIESLVRNTLEGLFPPAALGDKVLTNIAGFDILGGVFTGNIKRENFTRNFFDFSSPDDNIILNMLPSTAMTAAYFINNRKVSLAASSLQFFVPIVQNILAKRGALDFNNGKEADFVQAGINLIPFIIELVKPFINLDGIKSQFNNVIEEAKKNPQYAANLLTRPRNGMKMPTSF